MKSENTALKLEIRLVIVLMVLLAIFQSYEGWRNWRADRAAMNRRANLQKALSDLDAERQKVFTKYAAAPESYETKSVMHQQYPVANAQLKLQNVAIQQEQLLSNNP